MTAIILLFKKQDRKGKSILTFSLAKAWGSYDSYDISSITIWSINFTHFIDPKLGIFIVFLQFMYYGKDSWGIKSQSSIQHCIMEDNTRKAAVLVKEKRCFDDVINNKM